MHRSGHKAQQKTASKSKTKKLISKVLPAGIPKLIIPSRHIIGLDEPRGGKRTKHGERNHKSSKISRWGRQI